MRAEAKGKDDKDGYRTFSYHFLKGTDTHTYIQLSGLTRDGPNIIKNSGRIENCVFDRSAGPLERFACVCDCPAGLLEV